jgi:uncharacterized membrane-anchored protein
MSVWKLWITAIILLAISVSSAFAEETKPEYQWVKGGTTVDMGKDLSTLKLDPSVVYLNDADTQKMQEKIEGSASKKEIGSLFPADAKQGWYVLFEYDDSGFIKDDEKKSLDADAILASYTKGTEENNKKRSPENQLFVTGWDVKPFYEEKTHNLSWSMLAKDAQGNALVNYNVRTLTRHGYISAILVSDPGHLQEDKKVLTELILPNLTIKDGQKYENFDATKDKVSKLGLSALIMGGVGLAVAKKVGLIAVILLFIKKAWVVIAALVFGGWRLFRGRMARKASYPVESPVREEQPVYADKEVAAASESDIAEQLGKADEQPSVKVNGDSGEFSKK